MSSFGLYLIGFIVIIGAVCYGAYLIGIPTQWIGIGAAILAGVGIITGVGVARRPDRPQQ